MCLSQTPNRAPADAWIPARLRSSLGLAFPGTRLQSPYAQGGGVAVMVTSEKPTVNAYFGLLTVDSSSCEMSADRGRLWGASVNARRFRAGGFIVHGSIRRLGISTGLCVRTRVRIEGTNGMQFHVHAVFRIPRGKEMSAKTESKDLRTSI
jgi:hypothetical protein